VLGFARARVGSAQPRGRAVICRTRWPDGGAHWVPGRVICFNLKRITVLECPNGCKGQDGLSKEPQEGSVQADHGEEVRSELVVARGYSALALDALEEVLDAMTALVEATVEWALPASTRGRGDHNAAALFSELVAQALGVVPAVTNDVRPMAPRPGGVLRSTRRCRRRVRHLRQHPFRRTPRRAVRDRCSCSPW
jgi:hypothetical protein